jgi:alpha-L-fucosidase
MMTGDRAQRFANIVRSTQPDTLIDGRLGTEGDYKSTGDNVIPSEVSGEAWEVPATINHTWGFRNDDTDWKSPGQIAFKLVDIVSKGGNYLLNVGPTSEGLIPEPSVERLQAVGEWMKVNGVAIYDTTASPFRRLPWGRCTKKVSGNTTTLFLHVFNWPTDGKLIVPGLKNKITSAKLLATGKKLKAGQTADGAVIDVHANAPDPISSTVVLKIKGATEVGETPIIQESDGSVRLMASEAELHGGLQYESGGGKDCIGYWTNPDDFASWSFNVDRPGKFQVVAEIASLGQGKFEIIIGDQKVSSTAPNTGDYTRFRRANLTNTLDITTSGKVSVSVKPVKEGWEAINLKSLTLKPAPAK